MKFQTALYGCWVMVLTPFSGRTTGFREGELSAMSEIQPEIEGATVRDVVTSGGSWDWSHLSPFLSHTDTLRIASLCPSSPGSDPDVFFWRDSSSGDYRSITEEDDQPTDRTWKLIWSWKGPERIRIFLWLPAHGKLLTNEQHEGCLKPFDEAECILNTTRSFSYSILMEGTISPAPLREWRHVSWSKPNGNWLQLNTDGASRGNSGIAGAGGLIRDSGCSWICSFVHNVGIATSVLAEM
ncbi:hypothetical protein CRG98_016807 [Punica granatum]|uniref:Reverse transcriptase zinc-binding domain-containing protein n=1 Tax=Punica granatum TaxID=22663 RepID=A0A2I0K2M1_PUNGR|nr:hypothetical protein CRG98_016807 [Punica granatum]